MIDAYLRASRVLARTEPPAPEPAVSRWYWWVVLAGLLGLGAGAGVKL